jgi:hypothetical protein
MAISVACFLGAGQVMANLKDDGTDNYYTKGTGKTVVRQNSKESRITLDIPAIDGRSTSYYRRVLSTRAKLGSGQILCSSTGYEVTLIPDVHRLISPDIQAQGRVLLSWGDSLVAGGPGSQ